MSLKTNDRNANLDQFDHSMQSQTHAKESHSEDESQIDVEWPLVVDHTCLGDPEENTAPKYADEAMLRHLYKRCRNLGWFKNSVTNNQTRLAFRSRGETESDCSYLTAPHFEQELPGNATISLVDVAEVLQCGVLVSMTTKVIQTILKHLPPTVKQIHLDSSTQLQVLDTLYDIFSARKAQHAAFIRESDSLLVWTDEVNDLIPFATNLETKLVHRVWDDKNGLDKNVKVTARELQDIEKGYIGKRQISLVTPCTVGIAIMAIATFFGQDIHEIVLQAKAEKKYFAIFIVLYFPFLFFLSAFFAHLVVSSIFKVLGPISQMTVNSKFHSGTAPASRLEENLPHITIQCPVYMEDLRAVLEPAIISVKEAVSTYELQGGTANIFVNDDGLQLITQQERESRITFYKSHNIGWVARPPNNVDGFIRAGKFKKASNMNYCLYVSQLVEQRMERVERHKFWTDAFEMAEYTDMLEVVTKMQSPTCLGDGDIKIGDLILLIDADTRIPTDCLLDAVTEFDESPDLAILQHASEAFQVVHNYWEDVMAYFTKFVSQSMAWFTAGGDVAPFVGHNAFLRWSAVQEVAYQGDGRFKWWSEEHVSEDFEMSLRLQDLGYTIRMATYSNGGFKEGVSLTVYDEINRWQKYAYGVAELMMHPARHWLTKGPFTPLFLQFLRSKRINWYSKFTMLSYMGTYYAIASWWLLAIINYFLLGWFQVYVSNLYQSSWLISLAVLVVFDLASPVVNAIYRFRTRQSNLLYALYEEFKWMLLLLVFFGGLSMHVAKPLIYHLCDIPISWESTAKTLEDSYFLQELPMIWRRFKYMYLFVLTVCALMFVLSTKLVPDNWRIEGLFTGFPLGWMLACHALSPLILNPQSFLSEIHV